MRRCVIIIITVLALFDFQRLPAQRWLPASPWHVRTNLVHDVLLVPNVGAEYELSDRWTVVADASVAWWVSDRRQRHGRSLVGSARQTFIEDDVHGDGRRFRAFIRINI